MRIGRIAQSVLALVVTFIVGFGSAEYLRKPVEPMQGFTTPFDTTQVSTMRAIQLKSSSCRLPDRSPSDLAMRLGGEGSDPAEAYRETVKNCWVDWHGTVVETINWPDAIELVVADSVGHLARLNVGPINRIMRDNLVDRQYIAYSGLITGELEGVPLVSYIELWPGPHKD